MKKLQLTEEEIKNLTEEELALWKELQDNSWPYKLELAIGAMLLITLLVVFAHRFIIIIPAGHAGALYSLFFGGTQTNDTYTEGIHFIFPLDNMTIYDVRVQEEQDTVIALTEDGLRVSVEVSFRYFPDYYRIGHLHKELGPDYLHTLLVPHVSAITRDVISHYRVDKLYYSESRDSIQKNMTHRTQRQITDNYPINFVDVVIRNIMLPEGMDGAITSKLIEEQKMLEYDYRIQTAEKEAIRRKIEGEGIKDFTRASNVDILKWEGINATKELATSNNTKVIVVGTGTEGLPVILGGGN